MADEFQKLFVKASETYPEASSGDAVYAAARGVTALVPKLGGVLVELFSLVLTPSLQKRRDEWFKELADVVEELKDKQPGFQVADLSKNESFVSAVVQTTHIATATHQQEKLKYLRNALLNIALGKAPDEIRQQIFLNAVEVFSPAHVKTLSLIWRNFDGKNMWDVNHVAVRDRNYGAAIQIAAPELKGQLSLIPAILSDLRTRGFSNLSGPEATFPLGGQITSVGIEFLNFVFSPEGLPN